MFDDSDKRMGSTFHGKITLNTISSKTFLLAFNVKYGWHQTVCVPSL